MVAQRLHDDLRSRIDRGPDGEIDDAVRVCPGLLAIGSEEVPGEIGEVQ
jgi:hypothetical protein